MTLLDGLSSSSQNVSFMCVDWDMTSAALSGGPTPPPLSCEIAHDINQIPAISNDFTSHCIYLYSFGGQPAVI